MPRTIKPLHDFVLIERLKLENRTETGLHLPERRERNHDHNDLIEARVVAVGQGTLHDLKIIAEIGNLTRAPGYGTEVAGFMMPVKVGDLILVCEGSLHEAPGTDRSLVPVGNIFAIIEADA